MIKAAFFDIDGTLLSFKTHAVSAGTIRAFDFMRSRGVHTFISTGRPQVLIPKMPLVFDGHVTMNGGLVFTPDRVLYSNPIPRADSNAWLRYAKQHNLCTMLFTRDGMMATQLNATGMAVRSQLEFEMPPVVDIEEMYGCEVYQIIALMPAERDAEVAALLPNCRLPRWHPAFTDIVAAGNSKAVGMEAVCQHFGIAQADTIAFGDGGNDVEMLRWAGIGVAMGNAAPEVQQQADMITTDVDHEGIGNAIEKIFGL